MPIVLDANFASGLYFIQLPGLQPELLEELSSLGRPTIVCMINGALLSFNVTSKLTHTIKIDPMSFYRKTFVN